MLNLINLFHIKLSIILSPKDSLLTIFPIRYIQFYANWKFMLHSYCLIHYAKEFSANLFFQRIKQQRQVQIQ